MNRKNVTRAEPAQSIKRAKSPKMVIDDKALIYGGQLNKETVMVLKQKAAEKSRLIERRKKAAVIIQSIWRGVLFRRKFRKIKPKLLEEARKRVQRIKKLEFIAKHAEEIICEAIYDFVLKKRAVQKEILRQYVEHCVIMIQKNYKGYAVRKEFKIELYNHRRMKTLLEAAVQGWKTRKCWENKNMQRYRREIAEQQNEYDEMEDDGRQDFQAPKKKYYRKLRQRKVHIVEFFDQMYEEGSWMHVKKTRSRKNSDEMKKKKKGKKGEEEKDPEELKREEEEKQNAEEEGKGEGQEGEEEGEDGENADKDPEMNAFEARENRPVGGSKNKNQLMEGEEEEGGEGQHTGSNKKREFLKKKQKYDPRKAIEDSKKKLAEDDGKKNKSEEFRDMIKAARNFGKGDAAPKRGDDERPLPVQNHNYQNEEKKEDRAKKFTFLKRSSKNPGFQKLNWKNVAGRTECWTKRNGGENSRSASPKTDRIVLTAVPKSRGKAISKSPDRNVITVTAVTTRIANQTSTGGIRGAKSPTSKQQEKTKKAAGQKGAQKPAAQPVIKIEELEKAFKANFATKFATSVIPFFAKGSVRDPEEEQTSMIPVIKTDSKFVVDFDLQNYQKIMLGIEKHYKKLQKGS